MTRVSVVMPTCDRPEFLADTLASIRAQTFTDWELVIADDGSAEPARSMLGTVENAKVLWLPRRGNPGAVRNAGIAAARGHYVAFIDSDDLWEPDKLALQLEALSRESDCRWCYSGFVRIEPSGAVLQEEAHRPWQARRGDILAALIDGSASVRTPAVVAERSLLEEVGGFDESLASCEDYDLWMRLARLSRVAVVDEPLVRVRQNPRSHSNATPGLFLDRERSLRNASTWIPAPLQPALRRARARNSLSAAGRLVAADGLGAAFRHLRGALPFAWREPRWWLGGLRLLLGDRPRAGR